MAQKPDKPSLPPGCGVCGGFSHIVGPNGGAQRCDCPRGRHLAELEQQRKHPPAKPGKRRRSTHDGKAAAVGEA